MGDMADDFTENGVDNWLDHVNGLCDIDTPCQYCAEDKRQSENRNLRRIYE